MRYPSDVHVRRGEIVATEVMAAIVNARSVPKSESCPWGRVPKGECAHRGFCSKIQTRANRHITVTRVGGTHR